MQCQNLSLLFNGGFSPRQLRTHRLGSLHPGNMSPCCSFLLWGRRKGVWKVCAGAVSHRIQALALRVLVVNPWAPPQAPPWAPVPDFAIPSPQALLECLAPLADHSLPRPESPPPGDRPFRKSCHLATLPPPTPESPGAAGLLALF